jgi:F0F1-type ATP synthase assembly protein I
VKLEKTQESIFREASPYLGLGLQLAGGVIVFFYLGSWADEKLHTSPWLMLTGVLIGVVGGFIKFFKTAADLAKNESTKNDEQMK